MICYTNKDFKEPLPGETEYKSLGNGAARDSSAVPIPLAANAPYHKTVNMKLIFEASPELIYECLLDSDKLAAFTHSEAKMDRSQDGEFSIFGGEIVGRNKELSQNQKIVQDWRFKSWPEGIFFYLVNFPISLRKYSSLWEMKGTCLMLLFS